MKEKYNLPIDYEKKAEKYGKKYNLKINKHKPGWDDEVDAFRHVFMQACITANKDEKYAKTLGDAYEFMGSNIFKNQPKNEENMDKWNNAIGREIGEEIKREISHFKDITSQEMLEDMIAERIIKKIKQGDVITNPKDRRDFDSSIYNGRFYTKEEIGQMSSDEYDTHKKMIDKHLEQGKIKTEESAKKEVQSGSLIWVKSYKRDNGTEVKGYYRSK